MGVAATTPSSDLADVQRHLLGLAAEQGADAAVAAAIEFLGQVRGEATSLAQKNRALQLQLQQVLRQQTGRRTEKVSDAQLRLVLDQVGDDPIIDDSDTTARWDDAERADDGEGVEAGDTPPKRKRGRKKLPEHLPREVHEHELAVAERACTECGVTMQSIGDDISEVLRYVPGRFVVDEHRRAKYACQCCDSTVVTAPGPKKLIDKGIPSPSLVAHVLVNKYEDHLPLARQATRFGREGVPIAKSTLGGWLRHAFVELEPLVERLWERLDDAHLVQVDASGLKVLDRSAPGNIRKGTMWCYVAHEAERRTVLFDYVPTGDGASGPWKRLADRQGYIQADAASVFDRLYNGAVASATEVGCWAHARRKFFGLHETEPSAARALQLIGKLFKVERLADGKRMPPDKRLELRRQRSKPVLDRLLKHIAQIAAREPPQSALAKAARYAFNHREALSRFLEDGRLPLTNNLDELQIRSLAIGRKNYLFAGSDEGGRRSAVFYSLLRSCAVNGVEPFAYLNDVLTKLANGWPAGRLDELLPDAYAK